MRLSSLGREAYVGLGTLTEKIAKQVQLVHTVENVGHALLSVFSFCVVFRCLLPRPFSPSRDPAVLSIQNHSIVFKS